MKIIFTLVAILSVSSCGLPLTVSLTDPASGVNGSYSPKGGLVIDIEIPTESGK